MCGTQAVQARLVCRCLKGSDEQARPTGSCAELCRLAQRISLSALLCCCLRLHCSLRSSAGWSSSGGSRCGLRCCCLPRLVPQQGHLLLQAGCYGRSRGPAAQLWRDSLPLPPRLACAAAAEAALRAGQGRAWHQALQGGSTLRRVTRF